VTPEERIAKLRKLAENAVLVSGRHWRGYRFDTVGGFYDTSVADVVLDVLDALTTAERERDERDRTIAALMRGLKMLSQQVQTAEEERIRILLEALFWSEPWPTPLVSTVLRAMGETP
jgi:hypothetical protein